MHIAVIPARSGSKRIPKKNIKIFNGKPIIAWSILTALNSNLFDKVIVSTNDKKILKLSNHYGAETPFLRSENLSDDKTHIADVIENAISILQRKNWEIETVCCMLPTSPLINTEDLKTAKKIIKKENIDFVFTATNFSYPMYRAFKLKKNPKTSRFFLRKCLTPWDLQCRAVSTRDSRSWVTIIITKIVGRFVFCRRA